MHRSCKLGSMLGGFGARLREQREAQHIELAAIADQTKIKRSLLEALERDDLSQWPSGIFRRSWLRTYAQAIGLDPDATVREFLEVHAEPEDLPVTPVETSSTAGQFLANPGSSPRWGIVGAALESLTRRMRGSAPDEPVVDARPPEVEAPPPPPPRVVSTSPPEFDLQSVARICTKFGQVTTSKDVQPLLQEVATILDATGLIVWLWHSTAAALRPALVYGYSAGVVARLPAVSKDADNPTAASFRSGQIREIDGGDSASGALVIPLLLRARCVGVLAIELQPGRKLSESARAVAVILAASVAQLVSRSQAAEARLPSSKRRAARLSAVQGTV